MNEALPLIFAIIALFTALAAMGLYLDLRARVAPLLPTLQRWCAPGEEVDVEPSPPSGVTLRRARVSSTTTKRETVAPWRQNHRPTLPSAKGPKEPA